MPQLTIVAFINARPGCEAALAQELSGLVEPSRAEAGCLRYELHRNPADPAALVFIEAWTDREAHQAHMQTPHFLASRARQNDLVASREARFFEPV